MEDESRVAPEYERPMDVVFPSLIWVGSGICIDMYRKWITSRVGSS